MARDLRRLPLERADSFLVIADDLEEDEPAEASDTKCITSLLVLRDVVEQLDALAEPEKGPRLVTKDKRPFVCEVMGFRTKRIIQGMSMSTGGGDHTMEKQGIFFFSNQMECSIFSRCTSQPFLVSIIEHMLVCREAAMEPEDAMRGRGCSAEVSIETASEEDEDVGEELDTYLASYRSEAFLTEKDMKTGVTFKELSQLCRQRRGILLGWYESEGREIQGEAGRGRLVMNPPDKATTRYTFTPETEIMVLDRGIRGCLQPRAISTGALRVNSSLTPGRQELALEEAIGRC